VLWVNFQRVFTFLDFQLVELASVKVASLRYPLFWVQMVRLLSSDAAT
jgi:hypothetical protein